MKKFFLLGVLFSVFLDGFILRNLMDLSLSKKLLVYYLLHTIPSAISAYVSYMYLPESKKSKKLLILLFSISFYLATIGIPASALIAFLLSREPKKQVQYKYEIIPLDTLLDVETIETTDFLKWEEGKVRKLFSGNNNNVKIEDKLLALELLSSNIENLPLIQKFLNEPDDSRLHAYSVLNYLEKVYQERISFLEQKLAENPDNETHIKLAQTYYEYAISGLSGEELKNHYIKKALATAEKVFFNANDQEILILLGLVGRIYKSLGNDELAVPLLYDLYRKNPNLESAIELCEALFNLGQYKKVKEVLSDLLQRAPYLVRLPILKVWINEKG